MDIQNIPPISTDQHGTHYAETPSSNIHSRHLTSTSSATQPHTGMTLSSSTSSSASSLVAEPSLATIHEHESPSTTNSFAEDADYLPPPPPPTTTITMPDDDPVINTDIDVLASEMNPAFLLGNHRFDKRKSSPAILGLPFGIPGNDAQLDLHLSQHRNSIEAAMLLANFNRIPTTNNNATKQSSNDSMKVSDQQQWQDDLAIATQTQEKALEQDLRSNLSHRRHSYDVGMNWKSMPQEFRERTDLLDNNKPAVKQEQAQPYESRITWTQDGLYQASSLPPYPPTMLHPHMYTAQQQSQDPSNVHPLAAHQYSQQPHYLAQPQQQYPYPMPPPPPPHHHHHHQQPLPPHTPHPSLGGKLPMAPQGMYPRPPGDQQPFIHPHFQQQQHGMPFHPSSFPPPNGEFVAYHPGGPMMVPPPHMQQQPPRAKRKRAPKETEEIVEAGDADFPDMCPRDVELAKTDPEARPRRQKLRFDGDMYTPKWVRYNGQSKEGLCDTCRPGRWLQLKNSAYWYHKQFYHGISSVSGNEFVQPMETRWVDQDLVEGLCHQCRQWVAVSNVKRKNSVLWFRHAHKCHVYHKPKNDLPRRP